MPAALTPLTGVDLDDLVDSFGWQERSLLSAVARKFARQMISFDVAAGGEGLPGGARRLLAEFVRKLRLFVREHRPRSGALLVDLRPVAVCVQFGLPLTAATLGSSGQPVIQAAFPGRMWPPVRTAPEGPGFSIL